MRKSIGDYLDDKYWRLNNLYWIINEYGKRVLFRFNWAQEELFEKIHTFNFNLKCRQIGITTFWCIYQLDKAIFGNNVRCGIIAHNREDAQEIFQDKIKYPFDNMFTDEHGDIQYVNDITATQDSARKLLFSNNSSIRVGTSLRSGTIHFLHITEYGKICAKFPEKAREIKTGALNTVHAGQEIVIEGTAEGTEGHFKEVSDNAQNQELLGKALTPMDYKFFFFPWWKHPTYKVDYEVLIPSELAEYFDELQSKDGISLTNNQKWWYTFKYRDQQDDMKREYPSTAKEAFEQSVIGAYYQKQLEKCRKEKRICYMPHDPSKLTHTAWDLGINDEMSLWFFQLDGQRVEIIDYYENSGEGLEHYVMEINSRDYKPYGKHYAPHDINKRDLISGRNRIERAKDLGITFEIVNRAADIIEDINEVRRMFFRFFFDETRCSRGVKCIDNYRKEWNDKLGCFRDKPLHNWASHGCDGLRTLTHAVIDLTPAVKDDAAIRGYTEVACNQAWMVG